MASLFIGFWLRNTSLVKVGNPISDGFRFSPCFLVASEGWSYLISFRAASRMLGLRNYNCI